MLSSNPKSNPKIRFRQESDDWVILFDPDSGNARTLNPIGVFIWKLLDGSHDLDMIVDKVHESYVNVPAEVKDQIQQFLEILQKTGFLEIDKG